jgi:hypothetical protein
MALVECPDCNGKISSSAPNCLHCGRPMALFSKKAVQVQRKGGKYEFAGFLLILVGMAACYISATLGATSITIGFVIFLIGRFM